MGWRGILINVGWILGLTLALILLFWFDIGPFRGPVYTNLTNDINTINTVAAVGFFDVFNKLFFAIVVLIIVLVHIGSVVETMPIDKNIPEHSVWYKNSERAYTSYIGGFPLKEDMILVSFICWLVSLPFSFFLWNVSFFHHTGFWLSASIAGCLLSVILTFFLIILGGIGATRTGKISQYKIYLTGLDDKQVMEAVGIPINIIYLEAKVIYVYKNIKVIFTDGKVSDVQ